MKYFLRLLVARPTLNLGILLIGLGMLLSSKTTFANDVENELIMESWMRSPFDHEFQESDLYLESWMATPFKDEMQESEMGLESWMVLPFAIENEEEQLNTETWMLDSWI
jgi:hypothetical protein